MCLPPAHGFSDMPLDTQKPDVPACENMNKIAEDMEVLRDMHMSSRRTTTEYLMLCLIGFAPVEKRDALMRVIQWTLEPLMLYSSYIKETDTSEFETIVITKKQVPVDALEEWLELFNMGICCIQFDNYMQSDMVTCLSRIHHLGKNWYGTFRSKAAARVRRDFYAQYGKNQKAKELARVLDVTGLAMTPRNMMVLHDRMRALQEQVVRLERQLHAARDSAAQRAPATEFAIMARANLASAYRRLQAAGDLHATASLTYPSFQEPASPRQLGSPRFIDDSMPDPPRGVAFVVRPPPIGPVTLFAVD